MPRLKKVFIYLASRSARRRDYLRRMKIPYAPVSSSYHERHSLRLGPAETVMQNALGKARHARLTGRPKKRRVEFILGADTLVFFSGRFMGKPKNWQQARHMLQTMSGKTHWVYSGVALIERLSGKEITAYAKTRVRFKSLTTDEIETYLKRITPFDKAGAYAIQRKPRIVANYAGSYSNVVGLPVELLRKMIHAFFAQAKQLKSAQRHQTQRVY